MKQYIFLALTIIALVSPTYAADIAVKGKACWTGSRDMMTVSKTNWGMSVDIQGTFMDDKSPDESSYFECSGHFQMLDGAMAPQTYNCMHYFSDGSQVLERGEVTEDGGTKHVFLEGTGRHKGVSGSFVGGKRIAIGKAPDNKFAACRDIEGIKKLAN